MEDFYLKLFKVTVAFQLVFKKCFLNKLFVIIPFYYPFNFIVFYYYL